MSGRTTPLWIATGLATAAALIAVTGGFSGRLGPVAVSARDAVLPAVLASIVFLVTAVRRRGVAFTADLRGLWLDLHRAGPLLVAAASAATLAFGLVCGTYAVGGSDSHCYITQAQLLASGRVALEESLGREAPWPKAGLTVAPVGFVPRPGRLGESVPICPPGYPLAMAALMASGAPGAAFWVVPLLAALLIAATGWLGTLAGGRAGGALAAWLTAASPVVLYQAVQPMSDVPAAAWWLLAIALSLRPGVTPALIGGLAAAAAIATRPNLLPLGAVLAASLVLAPRPLGSRLTRAGVFCLAATPGVVVVACLQWTMFGSPLTSGYGSLSALFAWTRIGANLVRYTGWFVAVHTALPLAGIAALFLRGAPAVAREPHTDAARWRVRVLVIVAVVTLGCYLPYVSFREWWYLRFLLPAIPLVFVLFATSLVALLERAPVAMRAAAALVVGVSLVAFELHAVRAGSVLELARLERRFPETGRFVASALPPRAVIITVQQSGAVRYYAARSAVLWDTLAPEWLDRAIAFLDAHGRPPYLLIETSEAAAFRERFAVTSVLGTLDWPPLAEIGPHVRLYDPRDRARYLQGAAIKTTVVRYDGPWSARRLR